MGLTTEAQSASTAPDWLSVALAHRVGALHGRQITVRSESAEDIDFSASLYALTRETELAAVDWPDAQKREFCRLQFDAQHAHYRQHYPKALFLIIERDEVPVGRVYFEQTGKELRLMEITLAVASRNSGIGGAISSALLEHAHSSGIPMGLHVESFNPARRLYERQGFREIETRGIYLYIVCPLSSA